MMKRILAIIAVMIVAILAAHLGLRFVQFFDYLTQTTSLKGEIIAIQKYTSNLSRVPGAFEDLERVCQPLLDQDLETVRTLCEEDLETVKAFCADLETFRGLCWDWDTVRAYCAQPAGWIKGDHCDIYYLTEDEDRRPVWRPFEDRWRWATRFMLW